MEIIATGFGLPEGPVYDEQEDRVLITDATGGGVWAVRLDSGTTACIVGHRRGIGGLALHADGGYVISGRNVAWKRDDETVVLIEQESASPTARFNDLTATPMGGIYVGSIDYDVATGRVIRPGDLHYIDPTGEVRIVASGFELTNGLGVSPDGATLYHVDTGPGVLYRYDIRAPDGSLSDRKEITRWPGCTPDGLAVAASGQVLVAVATATRSGFVSVVEPDGTEVDRWAVASDHLTSVCVGGRDGRSVFATMGGSASLTERAGVVARLEQRIDGLPLSRARVRPTANRHSTE
jgi:xylono-1,5-lactonase